MSMLKEGNMRKKSRFKTILFFAVIIYAFANLNAATFIAYGYKALDGDSITVVYNRKQLSVELDGIDCPELEQQFGKEAQEFTKSFIYKKKVTVEIKDYDEKDRMIGRISFQGKDLSLALIEEGLAWYDKENSSDKVLAKAQKKAKKAKKGLWKQSKPTPPWTFRKIAEKLKETKEEDSDKKSTF